MNIQLSLTILIISVVIASFVFCIIRCFVLPESFQGTSEERLNLMRELVKRDQDILRNLADDQPSDEELSPDGEGE